MAGEAKTVEWERDRRGARPTQRAGGGLRGGRPPSPLARTAPLRRGRFGGTDTVREGCGTRLQQPAPSKSPPGWGRLGSGAVGVG